MPEAGDTEAVPASRASRKAARQLKERAHLREQRDKADEAVREVLANQGKSGLGWSSGWAGLVEREGGSLLNGWV